MHTLTQLHLCAHCAVQDLADVERRAQAAETRHQELSAKLPETTAPLLRQISALQDASSAQVGLKQGWCGERQQLSTHPLSQQLPAAAVTVAAALLLWQLAVDLKHQQLWQ